MSSSLPSDDPWFIPPPRTRPPAAGSSTHSRKRTLKSSASFTPFATLTTDDLLDRSESTSPHPLVDLGGVSADLDSDLDDDIPRGYEAENTHLRHSSRSSGYTTPIINANTAEFSSAVTRPALLRLQTEIENQVAAASVASRSSVDDASLRSSFETLRTANGNNNRKVEGQKEEVEVLVHHVKPKESLPGIALQYGIDLPTLRRVNKLWANDTIALRNHLYIPIEACRFTQARDAFVRGPREGEITVLKRQDLGKHYARQPDLITFENGSGRSESEDNDKEKDKHKGKSKEGKVVGDVDDGIVNLDGSSFTVTPHNVHAALDGRSNSLDPAQSQASSDCTETLGRVLSVIRIPVSELAFFPKGKTKTTPSPSVPSPRRSGDHQQTPPSSSTSNSGRPSLDKFQTPKAKHEPRPLEDIPMTATMKGMSKMSLGPHNRPGQRPVSILMPSTSAVTGSVRSQLSKGIISSKWFSMADDGIEESGMGGVRL